MRRRTTLFGLGIGPLAAVLGLLPWLVTGMRLPLQNLWDDPTMPADMPVAFLPLNQYYVTVLVALLVTGWGVAGLLARTMRAPRGVVVAGVIVVHVVATVQTLVVLVPGLQRRTASLVYVAANVAVVLAATLVGVLVFVLVTRASRPHVALGASIAALALVTWGAALVAPFGSYPDGALLTALGYWQRFAPAVLVGLAIAWCGLRSRGWFVTAGLGLVLLWLVPAGVTAIQNSVGSRVLLPYPAELIGTAVDVLQAAATSPAIVLPPLITCVVVAAAGLSVRSR